MNTCILGAGAWGTAMAIHLDRAGHTVTLVPRRLEHALALAADRENKDYLPGFTLSESIQIGLEPGPVLMEAEVVFLACPSRAVRSLCEQIKQVADMAWRSPTLVALCKGMEPKSSQTPCQVMREVLPQLKRAVLSGPTFAGEVAEGKPTAIVLASDTADAHVKAVQKALSTPAFRVYRSKDSHGVELAACLKNVYAIGAGLCDGLKLGDNAKAAYLTRSLNEMVKLGCALGGETATFYGLGGFGDLVATCTGAWSRNRTFGEALGCGKSVQSLMDNRKTVVEGYGATEAFYTLCGEHHLNPPILSEIYAVLYEERNPQEALHALMTRELKEE